MTALWKEISPGIWSFTFARVGALRLSVFRPSYDRTNWYYSIDHKDSKQSYSDPTAAQSACLAAAHQFLSEEIDRLSQLQCQIQPFLSTSS